MLEKGTFLRGSLRFFILGLLVSVSYQSVSYAISFSEDLAAREKVASTQVISLPSNLCWMVKGIGQKYKRFQKGEWISETRFGKDGLLWDASDRNEMYNFINRCLKAEKDKMTSHPESANYKEGYQQAADMLAHAKLIIDDIPKWAAKEKLRLKAIAEVKRIQDERQRAEQEKDKKAYSQYLAFLNTSTKFLKNAPATNEALETVLTLRQEEKTLRRKTTLSGVLDSLDFMRLLSSTEEKLPFLVKYQQCLKKGLFSELGVDKDIIDNPVASFNSPGTSTVGALVCSSSQEGVNLEYDAPGLFSSTITVTMNTPKGDFALKLEEKSTGHWLAIELSGPYGSTKLKGNQAIIYTAKFPFLWQMTGG